MLGDGENVTFFQTTGVCHHGDPPVFCENDWNLMDGAYVIEAKQYHHEFTLNILERHFWAPTNVARLFMKQKYASTFFLRSFFFQI